MLHDVLKLMPTTRVGTVLVHYSAPSLQEVPVLHAQGVLEVLDLLCLQLRQLEKLEADEVAEYEKVSQENALAKKTKEQDVKYKTQEFKGLDNSLAESAEELKAAQKELDAVLDYYDKVKQRCVAKPEPYEERVKRRNAEIKGLRNAISILDQEAALAQTSKKGSKRHFLSH